MDQAFLLIDQHDAVEIFADGAADIMRASGGWPLITFKPGTARGRRIQRGSACADHQSRGTFCVVAQFQPDSPFGDLWNISRLQFRTAWLVSEGDLLAISVKRQPPEGQHILVTIDDLASVNAGAYRFVFGSTDVALPDRR